MVMNMIDAERKGMVLRIERSSIHDGDGFRTVIFLKGCPLRCAWCSTPESHSFDVTKTKNETYGTEMTVQQVMHEVRKDSLFFFISTGGLTLSGGEILAQPEFTKAILMNAKKELFNTAIETSFFAKWGVIKEILPYVNTAFVDLKIYDPKMHMKYTKVDNSLIKENLLKTNELDHNFRIVVRTPIIPGINNSEEELRNIGKFCRGLKHLSHVQLLPYHKLGTATYDKLGMDYALKGVDSPTQEEMETYRKIIGEYVTVI